MLGPVNAIWVGVAYGHGLSPAPDSFPYAD
jgi:hypothetical protein